jgi:hypothetical protein
MDDCKSTTQHGGVKQGSRPRVFQKRDGSLALAVEETPGVITIGRLVIVLDPSELDHFENALQRARNELKAAVGAIIGNYQHGAISNSEAREEIEVAFARYDYAIFHALEALRP